MLPPKSVAIIGGGFAGLSLGIYLQRAGFSTTLFEKNSEPGGVAYAWQRKGYTFDGATNWLAGSAPTSNMYDLLNEVFDMAGLNFINPDIFIRIDKGTSRFSVYTDAHVLREELHRIAPDDVERIDLLIKAIIEAATIQIPFDKPPEFFTPFDAVSFLFRQPTLVRFYLTWKPLTIAQYAAGFKSPALREFFTQIFPHHDRFSMFALIMALSWMHAGAGGYPLGGSRRLIGELSDRYKKLGGIIRVNAPVDSIILAKGRATGVRCAGEELPFHSVVSTIDEVFTREKLLGGVGLTSKERASFGQKQVYPALVQISLGINRQFQDHPHKILVPLMMPVVMGRDIAREMMVRICSFDPTLSPEGKTSVIIQLRTADWEYWQRLRETNREGYAAAKEGVAAAIIQSFSAHFGDISRELEVVDVATPATWMRYGYLHKGSYQGWAPTPKAVGKTLCKQVQGVKNFYMVGQWQWAGGGIPGVVRIARHVAMMICRREGRRFFGRRWEGE